MVADYNLESSQAMEISQNKQKGWIELLPNISIMNGVVNKKNISSSTLQRSHPQHYRYGLHIEGNIRGKAPARKGKVRSP